jgi:hypothetical protein
MNNSQIIFISFLGTDTDPSYLQTVLRQILYVRLQLLNAEEVERQTAEKDLLDAWKVRVMRWDGIVCDS